MKLCVWYFAALGFAAQASALCDRACLQKSLDTYLSAVVHHDPAAAGLGKNFRYTENSLPVKAGDGLWKTATALGKVQRRYFDAVNGQAAYFGLMDESGGPSIITLRIRVVKGKVTEGELVAGRKVDGTFDADGLAAKPPREGAGAEKQNRQALLTAAQSYFEGIQHSDGTLVIAHKGCERVENGVLLTGRPPRGAPEGTPPTDCATLGMFKATISGVVHRRFPMIDEEAGVVLGMGIFNRPPGAKRSDGSEFPRNLLTEYFYIEGGKIRRIYAAMHYMTPDNPNAPGW